MRIIGVIAVSFALAFISCGKETDKKTTQIIDPNAPVRFDSIDWSQETKHPVLTAQEVELYRNRVAKFHTDFWKSSNVSGGLLVAKNGKIIFEQYAGLANVGKNTPLTADTPIHIASISKVLTGVAILKLVENNKLKLDDKVQKYLPTFPYEETTVRNLLNHRSGLPNYANVLYEKKLEDRANPITNEGVLEVFANNNVGLVRRVDSGFFYSNTNFVLLALIIEKIQKMPFPQAMKYMVFDPIGMKNTFIFEYDKHKDIVSESYGYAGSKWNWDHLDKTYGDKNVYSTPRDLFKLDQAMYSDKFLSKAIKDEAYKGYSYESKGYKNYGLAMRLLEYENNEKLLYHNGWWHGNNTVFVHDTKNKFTVIALGNRQNKSIYSAFRLAGIHDNYPLKVPEKDSIK
ncbi:serine hydrolase domain-containing protein [Faecalibacter rhinopitheci]|uniref:Beta-lactamase family protein n=1 Tax=Faecalibacter rhinopitheci TaxID=2779678 RepID=A0A8J7FS82_9FLAO|nr:serine hydrolase domain-containing protein [Faecalibacter rhinopitheci]MBF0596637.1 beta-lactamase family protein [Faecalibacter rhinopitheci]